MQLGRTTSNRFWVALCLTLLVHAIVLSAFWMQPAGTSRIETSDFVDVEFAEMNFAQAELPSLEEQLQSRLDERIANLVSDANASTASDRKSTSAGAEEREMADEVEAELRAMEQAEFDRLAAQKKEFGLEGVPDDGEHTEVNTLSEWDKRYDGKVIVSYDAINRNHVHLPVPGYLCLRSGTVVVEVLIGLDGTVEKTQVVQSSEGEGAECMEEVAMKAARRTVFNPRNDVDQTGTITYRFVAQR